MKTRHPQKQVKVAEELRAAIRKDGRPQSQIADACPTLSRDSLNHFLHGRCTLSVPKFGELLEALGLEITKA